jgi:hypothetical protein
VEFSVEWGPASLSDLLKELGASTMGDLPPSDPQYKQDFERAFFGNFWTKPALLPRPNWGFGWDRMLLIAKGLTLFCAWMAGCPSG